MEALAAQGRLQSILTGDVQRRLQWLKLIRIQITVLSRLHMATTYNFDFSLILAW